MAVNEKKSNTKSNKAETDSNDPQEIGSANLDQLLREKYSARILRLIDQVEFATEVKNGFIDIHFRMPTKAVVLIIIVITIYYNMDIINADIFSHLGKLLIR